MSGPSLTDMVGMTRDVTLGEQVVRIAPLRLRDMAEAEKWLAGYIIRRAASELEAAGGAMSDDDRAKHMARAIEQSRSVRFESMAAQELLRSAEGTIYLIYLAARVLDPALRWQDFQSRDVSSLGELQAALDAVNSARGRLGKDDAPPLSEAQTA